MERIHRHGCSRRELHAGGDFREGPETLGFSGRDQRGQALVEAVRMIPGHKHLVLEEGLQLG